MIESSGPIESKHHANMNLAARDLKIAFKGYGFCLLVFDFDTAMGRMNYISNAVRADMLAAMREFIARAEGERTER